MMSAPVQKHNSTEAARVVSGSSTTCEGQRRVRHRHHVPTLPSLKLIPITEVIYVRYSRVKLAVEFRYNL
jgi:hypothetical protein